MEKSDFIKAVTALVERYIADEGKEDPNAQIKVNPVLLYVDLVPEKDFLRSLADSEEAIEDAAYAVGDETESASDYQASQNPDFYPARTLVVYADRQPPVPDTAAIEALAANYFS